MDILLQTFRLLKPLERIETKGNKLKNQTLEIIFGTTTLTLENLKRSKILEFIDSAEHQIIKKFYYYIKDVNYIPQAYRENFLQLLKETRPEIQNIESLIDEEKDISASLFPPESMILVTQDAINRYKQHLEYLVNVAMPENSREIGEAKEKGDLRENAEYSAALERQKKLQAEVNKLEEELKRAQIINDSWYRDGIASIGSKVTLRDSEGNQISYTILGPWDVNPDMNIISYASPLGKSMLGKRIGEKTEPIMNKIYTIEKIEKII